MSGANFFQLINLVARPTTWFVFAASFFGSASLHIDRDVMLHFYTLKPSEQAKAEYLILLPIAAFGFLIVKASITRGTFLSAPPAALP